MIKKSQAIAIKTKEELLQEFAVLEQELDTDLAPLREKLAESTVGKSNAQLIAHMQFVESWRDRVSRYFGLAVTLSKHSSSAAFSTSVEGRGIAAANEAYRRQLSAGFDGIREELDKLVDSIDSRVNACKKLLDIDNRGVPNRI